ncbi:MAG: lipoyl(octanoyl) transferase LipB [Opitutaceae bacterium]|jgi:lipoyl(octanoyl) transferase
MTENASSALPRTLPETIDWGRTAYTEAWHRQEEWVAQRIEASRGDTLVFTEHNPVFTIGLRSGSDQHLVWGAEQLTKEGIEVVKTNRGGDITYHGPGQIVGYPIVSIDSRRDLHAYLRFLEQVLIDSVGSLGLAAARRPGKTGIWLGNKKIAAIGVAVRRWVAYHGFALNASTDLRHFTGIIPCGIDAADGTVASLSSELRHSVDPEEVKAILSKEFWELFPKFLSGKDGF